jgi:hypothetical protein
MVGPPRHVSLMPGPDASSAPVTVESIPDSRAAKSGSVSSVRCYLLIK